MESKFRAASEVKARPQASRLPGGKAGSPDRRAAVTVLAPRIRWFNEPALVLVAYGALGFLIRFAGASLWRSWLASLLALFGAGFSLTAALYPRRDALDLVERLALAGLLSLAVGGISGFALIQSPWGLTLRSSFAILSILNAICYLVVIYRRRHLAAFEQPALAPGRGEISRWFRRQSFAGILIGVVLLATLVAGAGALQNVARDPVADPAMTEFYLRDGSGQLEELPARATAGESLTIGFGVNNREPDDANYQVLALVSNQLVGDSGAFPLKPNQEGLSTLTFTVPATATSRTRVDFILFRNGKRDRDLYLWLKVTPQVGK
ncbi:MAG TPA: DUF1616 domain-containing protein [Anaerolineae bacterium]